MLRLPQTSEAERAWNLAKDTMSIPMLEAFIGRFKDTYYADLAGLRVEELKRQQAAISPSTAKAPPAKASEPASVAERDHGSYRNFQKLGCYYNSSEKRIWVAAIALNQKYLDRRFYQEEAFNVIVNMGGNRLRIDGKDVHVHPMADLDTKRADPYIKYSLVIAHNASIPVNNRNEV